MNMINEKEKPSSKNEIRLRPRVESELLIQEKDETDAWRILKIVSEFVNGFELLRKYERAATFFGTARCSLGDMWYKQAEELASRLSKSNFTIITGGASGIMEAANRGAFEAGGNSVGLNIKLKNEQGPNAFTTDSVSFSHFFSRKVMLSFASEVYVYFPGGFGTLDEFFELVTLVQTKKIRPIPIVLIGREYWEPLLAWIDSSLNKQYHTIGEKDMQIYHLTDSVDEAYDLIIELVEKYCSTYDC